MSPRGHLLQTEGDQRPPPLLELLSLLINVPSAFSGVVRRHAACLGQPGPQVWLQRGDSSPTVREGCAGPHTARGLSAEDSAPAGVGLGHRKSKPHGAGLCLHGLSWQLQGRIVCVLGPLHGPLCQFLGY